MIKLVSNIDHKRKHILLDKHKIISQDLIYARALGLLVSNRDLNFQEIQTHELSAYTSALFEENGAMRVCKNKATLKNKLKVEVSSRTSILTHSKVILGLDEERQSIRSPHHPKPPNYAASDSDDLERNEVT